VCLDCPLCRNKTWVEHYPEHEWKAGEYSLVRSSSWELEEVCLGAVWRYLVGLLRWSSLRPEEVTSLIGRAGEQQPTSLTNRK
jgi:hypothetical protein